MNKTTNHTNTIVTGVSIFISLLSITTVSVYAMPTAPSVLPDTVTPFIDITEQESDTTETNTPDDTQELDPAEANTPLELRYEQPDWSDPETVARVNSNFLKIVGATDEERILAAATLSPDEQIEIFKGVHVSNIRLSVQSTQTINANNENIVCTTSKINTQATGPTKVIVFEGLSEITTCTDTNSNTISSVEVSTQNPISDIIYWRGVDSRIKITQGGVDAESVTVQGQHEAYLCAYDTPSLCVSSSKPAYEATINTQGQLSIQFLSATRPAQSTTVLDPIE